MTEPAPEEAPRGGRGVRMLNGDLWMIVLRWAIRLTGLVSTVILARLLAPRDFGIVAMAIIVVNTLELFNQTGQKLVRKQPVFGLRSVPPPRKPAHSVFC